MALHLSSHDFISQRYVLLLSIYVLALISRSSTVCYIPDKNTVVEQNVPCSEGSGESVCYGPSYACLSNGICQATSAELRKDGATEFVRGSCTDKTWKSGRCPGFCLTNQCREAGIGKCEGTKDDTYYCIGEEHSPSDGNHTVTDDFDPPSFAGQLTPLTTISITATSSRLATLSMTLSTAIISAPATAIPPPAPESSDGNNGNKTTVITVSVAAPLGAIPITLFVFFSGESIRNAHRALSRRSCILRIMLQSLHLTTQMVGHVVCLSFFSSAAAFMTQQPYSDGPAELSSTQTAPCEIGISSPTADRNPELPGKAS
ncbi:hypothetical protein K469DRAFT_754854 [Zopfia rhizophila CBS 207.26]|uniref:Uncharacterized protein n=1 Tax=Zopfia rhizophila CBS 207.26 TaxID=1314779 RepID=A0A6A6DIZ6_9PEZI|nr:hypothetical protein K469DRAFT_754854 [Zopfia rhizophila CBS 207.26]